MKGVLNKSTNHSLNQYWQIPKQVRDDEFINKMVNKHKQVNDAKACGTLCWCERLARDKTLAFVTAVTSRKLTQRL